MKNHNYFVYITSNPNRTVVHLGVTNDLIRRMKEHYQNRGNPKSWAEKHHCHNLVFWERHQDIDDAIAREEEIKMWRRDKKDKLIESINPNWRFLNEEIQE